MLDIRKTMQIAGSTENKLQFGNVISKQLYDTIRDLLFALQFRI